MWNLLRQLIALIVSLLTKNVPKLGGSISLQNATPVHKDVVTVGLSLLSDNSAPAIVTSKPKYGELTPFDGPQTHRPKNLAGIKEMFGDPTRRGLYLKVPDPKWVKASIIELHGSSEAFLPVLAPDYFPIHKLIEPYAREAFKRAEAAAPGYIQRPGTWGFNFRHMRHDVKMPLSYHSYGIAIDVNPNMNSAHEFAAGTTPTPWSPRWLTRWPNGCPKAVVDAFKSCGFSWGGDWHGYCDPMHFEWVGARDVQV